jgi:hypothetical protein
MGAESVNGVYPWITSAFLVGLIVRPARLAVTLVTSAPKMSTKAE